MSEQVSKSDYDMCEDENSALRQHLLWAAQHLTAEQRIELRRRVQGHNGSDQVYIDRLSETQEAAMERDKAIERLCDYCDTIKDGGKASLLANELRTYISDWSRKPVFIPWGNT